MTVADLLTFLTRGFFFLLAGITFLDFLRYRDKIRRDVTLVFISLSANSLILTLLSISFVQNLLTNTGINPAWFTQAGSLAVLAQPFLLLRIVRYFRPIPPIVNNIATIGMVIAWIIVIFSGLPLPAWATLLAIAYFVTIDGYAVFAFTQGAFSSAGVTRQRLRFVAAGSALLALLLFIAGVRIALPATATFTTPIVQTFSVLSALSYYLGFAPPRWLRQVWQLTELRDYLQHTQNPNDKQSTGILEKLGSSVKRTMGTDMVFVALWDDRDKNLTLQKISEASSLPDFPLDGVIEDAWRKQIPLAINTSSNLPADASRLLEKLNAETLFIIPIVTNDRTLGLLIVFLQYGSLFPGDDLNLLNIFAQQTAVILENNLVVDELHHYAEDLERKVQERTAELKRSNEELQQFAYIASHDLQEPLRTISSYLQLIELRYADKLDNDAREFIAFAVDGGARMKDLIDDLLAYSRIETHSKNFKLTDSQKALDQARKFLATAITETEASITQEPLPQVIADEQLLIQLFHNLIGNALKYRSDQKPEIHIGATKNEDHWLFSVRDNGIGIEEQYLERIFIIFQRLHNRLEYPGTGIGLAVCKKAVEYLGGRIWAESEIGKGTTFYFTIPIPDPKS